MVGLTALLQAFKLNQIFRAGWNSLPAVIYHIESPRALHYWRSADLVRCQSRRLKSGCKKRLLQ